MGLRGLALALATAVVASSCGGAALSTDQQQDAIRSSFELNVWDESLAEGGMAEDFAYWVTQHEDGWVTVDISVVGADNLKALYFDLAYDPALLEPSGVNFSDRIAPEAERLEQIDLADPGRIFASEIARLFGARGFTGNGQLARVLFRRK